MVHDGIYDEFSQKWSSQFLIDRDNLEDEVIRQPSSFSYFATRAAKAESHADRLKYNLKVVEANLAIEKRNSLAKFDAKGGRKEAPVEAIKSAVTSDPRYEQAMAEYLDANERAAIYAGDVRASHQKGKMIELLAISIRQELKQKESL